VKETARLILIVCLSVCASSAGAFFAGREHMRREAMPVVDEGVRLLAQCLENNEALSMCDCPGPEECDMQATCNRDGIACCLTLARMEREAAGTP